MRCKVAEQQKCKYVGRLYTELFHAIVPTLIPHFLCIMETGM